MTSSPRSRKTFQPAVSSARSRSARSGKCSASTDLMRNGSMMVLKGMPVYGFGFSSSPRRSFRYMLKPSWTIRIASAGPMKSSTTTCLCSRVL